MAINPERTQFMLLDRKDRETCRVGFSKLCTLHKPIHQTNLANTCRGAVFNDDKIKMKRLCSTLVAPSVNIFYFNNIQVVYML